MVNAPKPDKTKEAKAPSQKLGLTGIFSLACGGARRLTRLGICAVGSAALGVGAGAAYNVVDQKYHDTTPDLKAAFPGLSNPDVAKLEKIADYNESQVVAGAVGLTFLLTMGYRILE